MCALVSSSLLGQQKALFIGNSLTFTHNIPVLLEELAEASNYELQTDMHAPGGTGFVNHVSNPLVYDKIREGNWDFVILQGGTSEMAGFSQPIQSTVDRTQQIADSVYLHNPCAQILFFELHAQEINYNPDCVDDQ